MIRIGIVGHEGAKFTQEAKSRAFSIMAQLLMGWSEKVCVVSGHCHLGGIDIWAEDFARAWGLDMEIHPPVYQGWPAYKKRNIEIAEVSDIVHVIVVKELPVIYQGMKHPLCYHCGVTTHIKSGGCWTGKYTQKLGKPAVWWEI